MIDHIVRDFLLRLEKRIIGRTDCPQNTARFLHFILHCTLYSSISRLHIHEIDSNFIIQLLQQGIDNIRAMSRDEKLVVRQVYNTLHRINGTKGIDALFRFLKQQFALLVA